MLSGGLDGQLEHGERLRVQRMTPEARQTPAPAPLAGESGLRQENHPAPLGDAPGQAGGANQLLEEV
ncbi:MAG: hypothetical protein ACXWLF_03835, partial [Myxococcaceae bacterium]